MCNHCDCGQSAQDQCSILGCMPIGFCCENCIGYDNRLTCENYVIYGAKFVNSATNHLKIISEEKVTKTAKEKVNVATTMINQDRWGDICNNCNCNNYDQCSIVGFMPIGFCCEKCVLYDVAHTCLKNKTKRSEHGEKEESIEEKMELLSTTIESGLLKVEIKKKGEKIPIYIDLQKHLE